MVNPKVKVFMNKIVVDATTLSMMCFKPMPEANHVEFELMKQLGKTFKMLSYYIKDEMAKRGFDITREQGMLLRRLSLGDGLIQNDLAWVTDRDKTSLARLLNKMESRQLVKREADPDDKRAKRVYLTLEGRRMAKKIKSVLSENSKRLFKGMSQDDMAMTMSLLMRIQNNLDHDIEI